MAAQTNGSPPDPKSVGNAFIEQYYPILNNNPRVAHRFYHEISELSRPGPDGQMISVTTLQVSIYWKGVFFHMLALDLIAFLVADLFLVVVGVHVTPG